MFQTDFDHQRKTFTMEVIKYISKLNTQNTMNELYYSKDVIYINICLLNITILDTYVLSFLL